jgi:hypothetical protein
LAIFTDLPSCVIPFNHGPPPNSRKAPIITTRAIRKKAVLFVVILVYIGYTSAHMIGILSHSILDFRFWILDFPLLERRGLQILDFRFWINDFMI